MSEQTKRCTKCGETKGLAEFSKPTNRICKRCNRSLTAAIRCEPNPFDTKKKCQKCKVDKELYLFDKYRISKDGRKSVCIECYKEMYKEDNRALGKSWFTARDEKRGVID